MSEKRTLKTLNAYKQDGRPIAMLTCYDYASAVLLERAGVDSILVGDSLAQVVLGEPTTLSAPMDVMVALTAAVRRGAPSVYLVADMPFMSYQPSFETAFRNAGRFLSQAGCDAVKLEISDYHLPLVEGLSAAGVPVIGHLGLRPQSIHQMGAYRAHGKSASEAQELIDLGLAAVKAGAVGLLLECVTVEAARCLTEQADVPVIGCGSGPDCDGQVLVWNDVMSLPGSHRTRFGKSYAEIGDAMQEAAARYVNEVHQGQFPTDQNAYHMNEQEAMALRPRSGSNGTPGQLRPKST